MNTKYGAVIIEVKKPIEVKKSEQEDPVIEEVLFQFIMPMGIPYGTAYDAVHDVLREINAMVEGATQRAVSMKKENSQGDEDKATSA